MAQCGYAQFGDGVCVGRLPSLAKQLDVVEEPDVVPVQMRVILQQQLSAESIRRAGFPDLGDRTQGGHGLQIRQHWRALDMDEEVDHEQHVAVRRERALVRRVDFSDWRKTGVTR